MRKEIWTGALRAFGVALSPFAVLFVYLAFTGRSSFNPLYFLLFCLMTWWVGLFGIAQWIKNVTHQYAQSKEHISHSDLVKLTESRREIVAAFEIERRRIERDLHDGAQQYLVRASMHVGEIDLVLDLPGEIEEKVPEVKRLIAKAQNDAEAALRSLRSTVAGIHPKVLSDLGLEAAVRNLCADSPVNVDVRVPYPLPIIPEGVIAAAYFLISEALTNVAKYAPQARTTVLVVADDDLHVSIVDDGPGGAVIRPDHGLAGLRERLVVFGGKLQVSSPEGGPTIIKANIPLLLRQGEFGVVPDAPDVKNDCG